MFKLRKQHKQKRWFIWSTRYFYLNCSIFIVQLSRKILIHHVGETSEIQEIRGFLIPETRVYSNEESHGWSRRQPRDSIVTIAQFLFIN